MAFDENYNDHLSLDYYNDLINSYLYSNLDDDISNIGRFIDNDNYSQDEYLPFCALDPAIFDSMYSIHNPPESINQYLFETAYYFLTNAPQLNYGETNLFD